MRTSAAETAHSLVSDARQPNMLGLHSSFLSQGLSCYLFGSGGNKERGLLTCEVNRPWSRSRPGENWGFEEAGFKKPVPEARFAANGSQLLGQLGSVFDRILLHRQIDWRRVARLLTRGYVADKYLAFFILVPQ